MKPPKLLMGLTLAAALVAGCLSQAVTTTLVYEPDPSRSRDARPPTQAELVEAVQRHFGSLAEASAEGEHRIRVVVRSRDAVLAKHVEDSLAAQATLEFRVLADNKRDADVVELARASKAEIVLDNEHKPVARWVPVEPRAKDVFADSQRYVNRTRDGESEVLVLLDDENINGAMIESAKASADSQGQPAVAFQLTPIGARRMGELTSANLPDRENQRRQMGIIVDGRLSSAPTINGMIYDRGEITGVFTFVETARLAAALDGGAIPVPLKLISREAR
jgi:preprotein translocase subunit SecD